MPRSKLAGRLRTARGDLSVVGGETIFGWGVMLAAAGAGIAFLDFILRNIPETLDDRASDFSDADSRTAALRNSLDEGMSVGAMGLAGSGAIGADALGNQHNNQVPVSHSGTMDR